MKIFFDTSILVEIDRHNSTVINLCKELTSKGAELVISAISISEILTGSYLRKDLAKAVLRAKEVLAQFEWVDFDAQVAEQTAKILAYRIMNGKSVDYQDEAIIASFLASHSDFIITLNIDHFDIPALKDKVFTPDGLAKALKKGELKFS